MGFFIDENTFQFNDENEMMNALGIDPETIEGDYSDKEIYIPEINQKFDPNLLSTPTFDILKMFDKS